jgi:hypothetical protein
MPQMPPASLLRRVALASALKEAGFPVAPKTLANLAGRGEGPPFRMFGRTALYRWDEAAAWAEARLLPPKSKRCWKHA